MRLRKDRAAKRVVQVMIGILLASIALVPFRAKGAQPYSLSIGMSGDNGRGYIPDPGILCTSGGSSTLGQLGEGAISPGTFSKLPGRLNFNLDVQTDGPPTAFLRPEISNVSLSNHRGTLQMALAAGDCGNQTLSFDGKTVAGSGTWSVDPSYTRGAYREATGSGTFTITSGLTPGGNRPWQLNLNGAIQVLQPSVTMTMVRSFWRHFGADYAGRIATVIFHVTNEGPGDAFDVELTGVTAPPRVTPVGIIPEHLGDLEAGESARVTFRFKIGHGGGPVIIGREFDTTFSFFVHDALDVPSTKAIGVHIVTPAYPPPL